MIKLIKLYEDFINESFNEDNVLKEIQSFIEENEIDARAYLDKFLKDSNKKILVNLSIYSINIENMLKLIKLCFNNYNKWQYFIAVFELYDKNKNEILTIPCNSYSEYEDKLKHIKDNDLRSYIIIEPIYGQKVEDIPDKAYHVTKKTNLDSILKNGMRPTPSSKKSGHYYPPRLYLFLNSEYVEYVDLETAGAMKFGLHKDEVIVVIELDKIKNSIELYYDEMFTEKIQGAAFTYENIDKKYIREANTYNDIYSQAQRDQAENTIKDSYSEYGDNVVDLAIQSNILRINNKEDEKKIVDKKINDLLDKYHLKKYGKELYDMMHQAEKLRVEGKHDEYNLMVTSIRQIIKERKLD